MTDPDQVPDLAEFAPATDGETYASVRAVVEHRQHMADFGELERLSEFERYLIDLAYMAGKSDVVEIVEEAVGPAAHTAHVPTLLDIVRRRQPEERMQTGILKAGTREQTARVTSLRAVRLVAQARRLALADQADAAAAAAHQEASR